MSPMSSLPNCTYNIVLNVQRTTSLSVYYRFIDCTMTSQLQFYGVNYISNSTTLEKMSQAAFDSEHILNFIFDPECCRNRVRGVVRCVPVALSVVCPWRCPLCVRGVVRCVTVALSVTVFQLYMSTRDTSYKVTVNC